MNEAMNESFSNLAAILLGSLSAEWQRIAVDIEITETAEFENVNYQIMDIDTGKVFPGNSEIAKAVGDTVAKYRHMNHRCTSFSLVFELAVDGLKVFVSK